VHSLGRVDHDGRLTLDLEEVGRRDLEVAGVAHHGYAVEEDGRRRGLDVGREPGLGLLGE